MIETQYISCLLCQIIGIYTHLNPLNLRNRATNIFISLLIHSFLLFATIRRYSSLFVTIRRYSRLFALFGHYSSLFATIRHYSGYIASTAVFFAELRVKDRKFCDLV